jgi:hypothetical protein
MLAQMFCLLLNFGRLDIRGWCGAAWALDILDGNVVVGNECEPRFGSTRKYRSEQTRSIPYRRIRISEVHASGRRQEWPDYERPVNPSSFPESSRMRDRKLKPTTSAHPHLARRYDVAPFLDCSSAETVLALRPTIRILRTDDAQKCVPKPTWIHVISAALYRRFEVICAAISL